ncbi:MAG: TonB-dependent receptor [Verrucomicrobiota bacterium]
MTTRLCIFACALLFPLLALAQTGTGTIVGRILKPATGEYVRNAEVRVEGRPGSAISDDSGYYRLPNIPEGTATIVVNYTGYQAISAQVAVGAGATVTRDFELTSSLGGVASASGDTPIKLTAFTVSSEREGNAKAIMQQRSSMDITNSVASDVFGDVAEGNVGEFLKHMPGVEIDLVQGEIRTIRLRGLDSEYTQVTMDGVSLASADAINPGTSTNARAFSFEQVSLSSMESIEVSKTISADVDANAPAGTINLKSKRAFSNAGRRVTAQANITAFSTRFNFDDSYGPDDRKSRKIHPGGIFEYSDVFFNKRLGVILNVSESMAYSANARATITYNYSPTAADPRPAVPTSLQFIHAPRTNRRSTVTLTTDFKATSRLVLSLGLVYNYAALNNPQRNLTFNTGARNTVIGTDPLVSFTTNSTAANIVSNPAAIVKLGQTLSAVPRFEYKVGNFVLDGKFAGSDSISWYDPRGRQGSIRDAGGPTLNNVTYTANRSSVRSADWHIVQTGGLDMDNGANFTSPTITSDDGRFARTGAYSGEIVATLRTDKVVPIVWKAGIKRKFEARDFRLDTESLRYTYTGPGAAATGAWAGYSSPFPFDAGGTNTDASLRSISGGTIWMPDLVRMGTLFREHPEQFAHTMTATNYYNAFIANRRYYEEEIDSAFFMGTATLGKLTLRGGLRREETSTDSEEYDPLTPPELLALRIPETAGRATTIDGLATQYFSKPLIHRLGNYDHMFPSASVKYRFTQNLDAHVGFSSTIRRPTFSDISGLWYINDDALTVNAPNPNLKPETSKNLSVRLAYYFEPVGILAINGFQNNVKGLFINDRLSAAEFGYNGDLDLSSYEFITRSQSEDDVTVRGMEYEYSQSLSFLPAPFKGLNVRASYTRTTASIIKANLIPHSVNAGLSYAYRRFNAYANFNWRDNYPTNITGTRFYRHRANVDIGGGFRFNSRLNTFFAVRNIFNEPYVEMEKVGAAPAVGRFYEVNGINWTFGIKATY